MDGILDGIKADTRVEPGDYVDSDGLLRCGMCDTRKQTRINLHLRETHIDKVVYCTCKCEYEDYMAKEAARKHKEFMRTVQVNKAVGFPSAAYEKWTFEADDLARPDLTGIFRRYADSFRKGTNVGLLIHGSIGTGKTFYSTCIANRLLEEGYSVVVTNIKRITNVVNSTWENRQQELDRILRCDMLVIDDLGTERRTDYMAEQIFDVIDGRYKLGKPMIISTNISLDQMNAETDLAYARIYSRIMETCYPVLVDGEDRRRGKFGRGAM